MELQVGVKVLIKNNSRKYLLQRRSSAKYPDAQIGWDVVGGRIIPGIPLLENLKREVKEETGLTLLKIEKILAAQDILRIKDKHIVRITYLGSAKGKVKLDKEENTEYKWFTLKELKKLPKKDLDMYFAEVLKGLK
jgi:ADP-ribose pyrophosphatase YjhB (NUDIX family)